VLRSAAWRLVVVDHRGIGAVVACRTSYGMTFSRDPAPRERLGLLPPTEQRDHDADKRDLSGKQRDQVAEQRDSAGDARDLDAKQRDHADERRDQVAEQRDQAAERSESSSGTDPQHAASDRMAASEDRQVHAVRRSQAERDRASSLDDRSAGAHDRTHAERDRNSSLSDRALSADDREGSALDSLTGVSQRGAGLIELRHLIAKTKRTAESVLIAFVDVDHLKAVNDTEGHAAGDRLLLGVANMLRTTLRPYDLIIRYGGDEFVCAISGLTLEEATRRLALVNARLAKTPEQGSVTVGFAALRASDSTDTVIARADAALYRQRDDTRGT
jgi:diguanylate cyclase (GGDEF)-like protein